jgi:hypothetical protein
LLNKKPLLTQLNNWYANTQKYWSSELDRIPWFRNNFFTFCIEIKLQSIPFIVNSKKCSLKPGIHYKQIQFEYKLTICTEKPVHYKRDRL